MSAIDIAGAVVWTPLAILFWWGALVPSKPPFPAYGDAEIGCFLRAVALSVAAAYCIARLCGASA